MPRRTKDEAEKTRNSILNAAEQVFYLNGVARTTLEQIAVVAKVTRGAVYWHFRDKIEVFDAMMKRVFLPHEEVLERLVARKNDNPLEDLKNAYCEALRMMGKDKRRRQVITIMMLRCEYIKEMEPIMKRRRACKDRMLTRTMTLLEQARELGHLAPQWTPRTAALSLQAMMGGLIISTLEGRKAFNFKTTSPQCLELLFDSMKKSGSHV